MSNGTGYTLSRHVESVMAALDLLSCFLDHPKLSIKELIDLSGLTRNRIMRLVGTLAAKGYLIHDKEDGLFTLGPMVVALGRAFERGQDLVKLARPILRELTRVSGESASIYVRQDLELVVFVREDGSQSIRYSVREGQRMPLHAGAPGKILLAFEEEKILDQLLAKGGLSRLTSQTISDPQIYRDELQKIRAKGFAVSLGERIPDAAAVAAPVFDHRELLVGALSLAGPLSRFTDEKVEELSRLVTVSAKRLSGLLGFFESDAKDDSPADQ